MRLEIADIDRNFLAGSRVDRPDAVWMNMLEEPIRLHGLASVAPGRLWRLPEAVISRINDGVTTLARHTAGGRVRFRTDSPYIAFRGELAFTGSMPHMPLTGSAGVELFVDGHSAALFRPVNDQAAWLEGAAALPGGMHDIELALPLYNGLTEGHIALARGASVESPRPYAVARPVVFYGSSITQGGCASKPGNSYAALLSRWLDADYVNLGFSGCGRGETTMAKYIAGLEMSVFVMDYDHNAPAPEHLAATHEPFFRIIREAQPELPIVMVSRPDCDRDPADSARRLAIIRATYDHAAASGDRSVWLTDGGTLFGTEDRDACTVDGTHPNDLGFYRMAKGLLPVIREALAAR